MSAEKDVEGGGGFELMEPRNNRTTMTSFEAAFSELESLKLFSQ
jgi:hypothetical protein